MSSEDPVDFDPKNPELKAPDPKDPDAPSTDGPLTNLRLDADQAAIGLRTVTTVLTFPAIGIVIGAALASVIHLVLAIVALVQVRDLWLGLYLAAAVAGLVLSAWFLQRVVATRRASRHPDLASDLLAMVDVQAISRTVLAELSEITRRDGLRAVSRARAVYRLLSLLTGGYSEQFPHGRWFIPPDISDTWARGVMATWFGLVAWVCVPFAIPLVVATVI